MRKPGNVQQDMFMPTKFNDVAIGIADKNRAVVIAEGDRALDDRDVDVIYLPNTHILFLPTRSIISLQNGCLPRAVPDLPSGNAWPASQCPRGFWRCLMITLLWDQSPA